MTNRLIFILLRAELEIVAEVTVWNLVYILAL